MIIAAVDLDGTLLRSDCTISDYSRRIIEEAISNNILIIPTSGRSFRNISAKIKGIKGIRYVISSNGSVITDCQDEKIIYEKAIDQNTNHEIFRYIKDHGGFYCGYSGNDSYIETDADQIMYATRINRSMCDDLLATDVRISSLDEMISSGKTIMDKVFFSFIDPEDIARCVNWLGKFANISYGYSTKYCVEIFPRNSNKDVALDYLCKYLSIPKENTIAIGDSENDVSMIQYVSFGVAVENSMKVLKEAADYIAPSNDKDGPAQVLEKIMTGSTLELLLRQSQ